MLGTSEIVIIAIVILILFGAGAIPKFAKSLGEAKKEFDKASKDKKYKEQDKTSSSDKNDKDDKDSKDESNK